MPCLFVAQVCWCVCHVYLLPRYADVYDGRYENIFVCNYGIGGNVVGQPVFEHNDCLTGK